MEISYIGHSCFKVKSKDLTLVIDPYSVKVGIPLPKLDADIVLVTHDHHDHNNVSVIRGFKMLIDKPGEYETQGVFVTGIPTYHDDKNGTKRGSNIIYSIDVDGFNVVHLGDLGHELSDDQIEKIGDVDVLMVPVGGNYTIDAETAVKIISSLEPGIVVPMHFNDPDAKGIEGLSGVDKFMDEMGVENNVKKVDTLVLKSETDIPDETEIVILNPAH